MDLPELREESSGWQSSAELRGLMLIDVIVNGELKKVEAKSVPFAVVSENWNEYQTEDGKIIRAKLVLTGAILPLKEEKNPDGTLVAKLNFQPVFVVEEKQP